MNTLVEYFLLASESNRQLWKNGAVVKEKLIIDRKYELDDKLFSSKNREK